LEFFPEFSYLTWEDEPIKAEINISVI